MQEALDTMAVRVIEEKVEQIVSAALLPPDTSLFSDTAEQIQACFPLPAAGHAGCIRQVAGGSVCSTMAQLWFPCFAGMPDGAACRSKSHGAD